MNEAKAREAICEIGASIFNRGLTAGSSGNISVRIEGGWLMTPTNASLGRLDPARLSKLDDAGRLIGGDPPTKESFLHRVMYEERGDTGAVVQERLGRERAGALVEGILADIARGLVAQGVRRLVVAGGETAGAVVQALGVTGLRIGRQIDPGVPWTVSLGKPPLALALKSGNFGAADFFLRAFAVLDGNTR